VFFRVQIAYYKLLKTKKEQIMKTYFLPKIKNTVLSSLFIAVSCMIPLHSAEAPGDKIGDWLSSCPYIGLVAEEISYGPITLKSFNMDDKGRLVIAKPNEELNCCVKYHIDSNQMESWNMYHVVVGIKGEDSQSCITHSLGLWDKKGKANFTLTAPSKKGVYEVRFDYEKVFTCSDAVSHWKEENPSSKATVGIIIIE
jgi:hypothetical protein